MILAMEETDGVERSVTISSTVTALRLANPAPGRWKLKAGSSIKAAFPTKGGSAYVQPWLGQPGEYSVSWEAQ